ncbi:hypothetical protein ACHAP8_008372 [Fusarium lateritium]
MATQWIILPINAHDQWTYLQQRVFQYGAEADLNKDRPNAEVASAYRRYKTMTLFCKTLENIRRQFRQLQQTLLPWPKKPKCEMQLSLPALKELQSLSRLGFDLATRHPYGYKTLKQRRKHERYLRKAIRQLER